MDTVLHFINDTAEFYKWSLTIAGNCLCICLSLSLSTCLSVSHTAVEILCVCVCAFVLDKRVERWPMMSSPLPTLGFSMLYLLFLWAGPRYMQHRDAFKLRESLIIYNFSMVLLNFYICKEVHCLYHSSSIHSYIHLSVHQSVHQPFHQSIHISAFLLLHLPDHPFIHPSIHSSQPNSLLIHCPSDTYPSVQPSITQSLPISCLLLPPSIHHTPPFKISHLLLCTSIYLFFHLLSLKPPHSGIHLSILPLHT